MTTRQDGARTGWGRVALAIGARVAGFAIMTALAVWNETRPGTKIADPILAAFPYVPWVERWNYELWLAAWLPATFALLYIDRARFCRFMVAGGLLSVLRGVAIAATGLGPVRGGDVNAALAWDLSLGLQAFAQILDPFRVFVDGSARFWLTKDLFFSGHAASTFLLLLYVWPFTRLRIAVAVMHVLVVASLFFGWIHYTIDVAGGWLAAALVFVLVERVARARAATLAAVPFPSTVSEP